MNACHVWFAGRLCRLGEELGEGFGEILNAPAERFADGVLHAQLEAREHFLVRLDAQAAHLVDRPLPDVIFFFTAAFEPLEADDVVADFVQEDAEAQGRFRKRGLDPVDVAAVRVALLPGAAAHVAPPFANNDAVTGSHQLDDRRIVGHASNGIGRPRRPPTDSARSAVESQ